MRKSLRNIIPLMETIIHNPRQSLLVYANEDILCDNEFFMRRNSRLLLDGLQLTVGLNQQGGLGAVHPPWQKWYIDGKIDLSLVNIGIYNVDVSFIEFLKQHFGDRPLVGAELGVWKGDNAISMLDRLNIKTLYLVDPYEYNEEFQPWNHDLSAKARVETYARMAPYSGQIKWLHKKSIYAIYDIHEPLDFCYVDTAHTREVVSIELPIYYESVKPDGIFAGHDYANRHLEAYNYLREVEVHSCVDEFIIDREIPLFYYSYNALQWFIIKDGKCGYMDNKAMIILQNMETRSTIGIGDHLLMPGEIKGIYVTNDIMDGVKRLIAMGKLRRIIT